MAYNEAKCCRLLHQLFVASRVSSYVFGRLSSAMQNLGKSAR
ncbi:Uncharacterized protein APZ42_033310 [Daphnia magna]|uniref:Uncharacterized protein n=1 Tax=Daphnia magna TaxID=35525 RepID=A0A164L7X4_9CRUS|nr:Uncharacterized protein APZ42_033310 [Daphnia magna]